MSEYKHILIGILVKNCGQYLENLAQQIIRIDYPKEYINIAFLENDSDDKSWDILKTKVTPLLNLYKYKSVYLQGISYGYKLKHTSRHIKEVQQDRYKCITQSRQYIINNFLPGNDFIWWVDADFEKIPPDTLKILLSYNVDCVAPLLKLKNGKLYDSASKKGDTSLEELIKHAGHKELIEIDATNCQELMHRRIFEKGANFYIEGEKNSHLIQSQRMKKLGIKFFLTTKVTVTHHTICGTKPL